VGRLGVQYPVAVDDSLDTWTAFNNEYWPAEYLIDQNGHVRHTAFGEGDYATTERDIRLLLQAAPAAAGHPLTLPPATGVPDRTPTDVYTPESYLGYERMANATGTPVRDDQAQTYVPVSPVPAGELTFGGVWTVHSWEATAGTAASIGLNFEAGDVYLVLGGSGTVTVRENGTLVKTVSVGGLPDIYTLVSGSHEQTGTLELTFSPGVEAYDFTFG
jgi:hypothetical protein